jgi:asparagine synthase (glutamine-hydrolysing)
VWVDGEAGVALGHRRLSILDLSALGAQPMVSACGRFVIVYNGEVYNHLDLRPELEAAGHAFHGHSDTETILAAIVQWGVPEAVKKMVGMFAMALWDREKRSLTLVRDRLGIKPLYYCTTGHTVLFGSELKALRQHPDFRAGVDRDALSLFFRHNYIPAPYSIYSGVEKLRPGTILTIDERGHSTVTYWSAEDVWRSGRENPFIGSDQEAVDTLHDLVEMAVSSRMLSDVPLGAFLSGGIDSSVVAAIMQSVSDRPVRTFSIGFDEAQYNEAPMAAAIARHLGTEHTELYVTPKDMLDFIPDIACFWDEPFADSSQVPTYYLSKLTREHVTVSLSGDGGDELFQGYTRYQTAHEIWRRLSSIPAPLRRLGAVLGRGSAQDVLSFLGAGGVRLLWRLQALDFEGFPDVYRYLLSHHKNPSRLVLRSREPKTALDTVMEGLPDKDRFMALQDVLMYLPDDILTKVDRASMAVGLEARVPLLDHRVVEYAATLPRTMKVRDGKTKWILRQVLERFVPRPLYERPKMGFGVPVGAWMRKELHDWCESLLDEKLLRQQGYLDAAAVRRMWEQYVAGHDGWQYHLWDVLMFQAWLERERGL